MKFSYILEEFTEADQTTPFRTTTHYNVKSLIEANPTLFKNKNQCNNFIRGIGTSNNKYIAITPIQVDKTLKPPAPLRKYVQVHRSNPVILNKKIRYTEPEREVKEPEVKEPEVKKERKLDPGEVALKELNDIEQKEMLELIEILKQNK